jgi:cadmium resistance protein CadD (predicted permease)
MIATAIIATIAFAATNVDDAFVLLGYFASPKLKDAHIVIGTYIGMAILVIAAMMLSAVSVVLFPSYLGLLGALPILIGLRQFWTAWSEPGDDIIDITPGAGTVEVIELVAIRTIANGGDNIAVYIPLFARQSHSEEILTCFVFAVLVGVWCLGAKWMVAYSKRGAPIRRWGRWVTPVVLISLGVLIFLLSDGLRR